VQSTSLGIADSAEQLRRVLHVADVALAHLSPEDLLDELLIRVREVLGADTAAVLLLDERTDELVATAAKGIEEEVEAGVRIPVGKGFAGKIASERAPVVIDRVDHRNVMNPILREKGIISLLGVPMLVHGQVLGVLHVGSLTYRRFAEPDVQLLQMVAERVALGLNVRLYEHERRLTEALQRTFLPVSMPRVPGLRFTSKYQPAAGIGGDWYDVLALPSGAVALAMGDVAGHGVEAAVAMGRLRSALRVCAVEGADPADVVSRLDRLMETLDVAGMVTLLFGIVDPDFSEFRFVAAGHVPPLVLKDGDPFFAEDGRADPPLATSRLHRFRTHVVSLDGAKSLLLYTDGLIERRDESLSAGLERLRAESHHVGAALNSAAALDSLVDSLLDGSEATDDIAVLLVELEAPSTSVHLQMAADPAALVVVRRSLERWLSDLEVGERLRDDVLTAAGEAVANSVEHAYGPQGGWMHVLGSREGNTLSVVVRDGGHWRKRGSGRGRGSRLMRALMDSVVYERSDGGTTVTMYRKLPSR
jgi:serine phosphatase RsbU (regulator of sigma subunit)/anti-sigma regulatory factor (Ser/Thr protein kinase)